MSTHPNIPYDQALLDDVAARLDLRRPNAEALEAVAKTLDGAAGEPVQMVCDLATAVGKTYLAAGLVEYLAASGVRHVLFVTPGRTILNKTVDNFTVGHPKSVLGGMECEPLVITAENFNTGATGAALRDDDQMKLLVFNVQQLIRPTDKVTRKTRKHQEWLGADLYQYLKDVDDLVVIADESHVYTEKAKAFYDAVADLDAMATVGLTATPSASDAERTVYHYPLARAIAERYVKTPVLVGRRDDAHDVETRLRDGLALLAAKQVAADAYAEATGARRVNAVMFVVADTIDNANAVAEVLSKPGLLGRDYESQVLVVHSDAPDDALARLASVEEPDSPVRVIVSVSMLKEGWDVKNIFVICSLRPSISDVLTEQTLGRGLRLPWGTYTGVELLDTVEVVSHERYRDLLQRAEVLLEGLVETREQSPTPPAGEPPATAAESSEATTASPTSETPAGTGDTTAPTADAAPAEERNDDEDPAPANGGGTTDEVVTPGNPTIEPTDQRVADAQAASAAMRKLTPKRTLTLPRVEVTKLPRTFNLSEVDDEPFERLGRQLADAGAGNLARKLLDVTPDATAPGGYRLVPRDATDAIDAARPNLPFGGAVKALAERIYSLDIVPETRASKNGAKRLADACARGANGEDHLAAYFNAAVEAARMLIHDAYRAVPEPTESTVVTAEFAPERITDRTEEPNRFKKFSRRALYTGFERSQFGEDWFDSSTELDMANLLDGDDKVEVWTRLHRGELVVLWERGRYNPDFYVLLDGIHYLLEVKADRDLTQADVIDKAKAATKWARFVTDEGPHGTWRYLVIPESAVKTGKTLRSVLTQAANR